MSRELLQRCLPVLIEIDGLDTDTESKTVDVGDLIEAINAALALYEPQGVTDEQIEQAIVDANGYGRVCLLNEEVDPRRITDVARCFARALLASAQPASDAHACALHTLMDGKCSVCGKQVFEPEPEQVQTPQQDPWGLSASGRGACVPASEDKPVAYMRKWAFDGEVPAKKKNANGRMAWPAKFKILPVTSRKIFPDDVALSTARFAPSLVALTNEARYRWLRDKSVDQWDQPIVVEQKRIQDRIAYFGPLAGVNLDAAIDAAIERAGGE